MGVMRSALLAASQNNWMRERASRYKFVRRSVEKFMPGEELEDAIAAVRKIETNGLHTVLTHLGESIRDANEATLVADNLVAIGSQLRSCGLRTELSVKPTQLGLEHSVELCYQNLRKILQSESASKVVWIDMEASNFVDATLQLYRRALAEFPGTGLCLQAYLYRTEKDFHDLLPQKPTIRLVKGAYKEPAEIAHPAKAKVDDNYFALAKQMLDAQQSGQMRRVAFGTHDSVLIEKLAAYCKSAELPQTSLEVHMLYGIQRSLQEKLAAEGHRSGVLVAYGKYWYPWYMRRLAERPANLWFVAKNIFSS